MKKFKFTIKGHNYDVDILKFEDNIANIEVNGTLYKVEVQQEIKQSKTPKLIRQEIMHKRRDSKIKKNISAAAFEVKAPLPGNIMHVYVKEGDAVSVGDKLLMYEAMKMENEIKAEKEGTIALLKVRPGDSVLQGDVLIEIG